LRLSGIIDLPSQLDPSKFQRFVFGILLIAFALYRPKGLIPAKRQSYDLTEIEKLSGKKEDQLDKTIEGKVGKEREYVST